MRSQLALVLLLAAVSAPLGAQAPAGAAAAKDDPVVGTGDAVTAAGFVLGGAALWRVDRHLAQRIQDSTVQAVRFAEHGARGFNTLARPGALVVSGALYVAGLAAGDDGVRDVGRHGLEAVVATEVVTRVVKSVAGRARPNVDPDEPHDFKLFRGWGDNRYQSFPSGHASDAFAAATVFTGEAARAWPGWEWVVGPVMYASAAMAGVSRMYDNKHWATDVLAGAALGTFVGLQVVRRHDPRDDEEDPGTVPDGTAPGMTLGLSVGGDGSVGLSVGPRW